MVKVSKSHVRAWLIPTPPAPEQLAIADFLDRETTRLDALKAKVKKVIDLLREHRTALISAAVTGKIDVRQEVAEGRTA
jgi:restriction endonuclease S subunit